MTVCIFLIGCFITQSYFPSDRNMSSNFNDSDSGSSSPFSEVKPKYGKTTTMHRKLTQVNSFSNFLDIKKSPSQPGSMPTSPREVFSVSPKDLNLSISISKSKSSKVIQQGYLVKEGSLWKTWKKRWFILRADGEMTYRRDFKDKTPIKTLSIRKVPLTFPTMSKQKYVLKLYFSPTYSLYMCAPSEMELENWAKALIEAGASAVELTNCGMLGNLELDRKFINGEVYVPKDKYIDDEFLKIGKKIGEGGQATVHEAIVQTYPSMLLAVKIYPKNLINGVNDLTIAYNEMYILSLIPEHENVLQFYGVTEKKDSIGIVTEHCSEGSLLDYVKQKTTFKQKISILTQIAKGIKHLHSNGVMHRDIKCENILISSHFMLKLCDFGLAARFPLKEGINIVCGTSYYAAPEILTNKAYDEKVDIYSFGIVMWMIIHENDQPYGSMTESEVIQKIKSDNAFRPEIEKSHNPNVKNLISSCWHEDPKKRATFDQIFKVLEGF